MERCTLQLNITVAATLLLVFMALPVKAQFSYRRTVGDETENQYQPGNFFAKKYRSSILGNPELNLTGAGAANSTRHGRAAGLGVIGGNSGIGGSSLQTESVTSESRPALVQPNSVSTGTPLIGRPSLKLRFESSLDSPALRTFQFKFPDSGEPQTFGRIPETFTNTSIFSTTENKNFSSTADDFQFGQ